ncbi:hypothetical protein SV7mr_02990 [Stieleria bergensis]|uniref:Trm112p-like protein n=1 Tax=Stieleria bergensis TaxID=2528025 RepID=A0A517SNW7_9BACT|nr:MAG: hypothetical protein CBB71_01435 [Rhodopirellula sp. TMED11]QDT57814.1 hypothetical protein SV7mr_02990 [Planctomycetes bacterium SV_7m_r]
MSQDDLLALIQCPITQQKLVYADQTLIEEINQRIEQNDVRDQQDQRVQAPLEGGLVSADGKFLYAIRGGIPTLVADRAIALVA